MFNMFVQETYSTLLIIALLLTLTLDYLSAAPQLDLIILHSNDMHSKFAAWDGVGGFARVSSVVKEHRTAAKNDTGLPVLYFDAGDVYTGSRWFNLFKDEIVTEYMNALKPDAMCLGNHEFDLGVNALVPFLEKAKFPIVFANYKNGADHPIRKAKSVVPSVILKIKGHKIGVVGYLTPRTKKMLPDIDVDFTPEIEAVNEEAKKLKEKGAKTIIGLGHSGFTEDLKIAEKCPLLDLVIGGHTHTFLYTGQQPDKEAISSPYPTIVEQNGGKKVPVVQVYTAAKYLGKLQIRINESGKIIKWDGNPILLNDSIPQDPEFLAFDQKYHQKEVTQAPAPFAESKLDFCTHRCYILECGIGNMMTDAFVNAAGTSLNDTSFASSVALMNSRNLRSRLASGYIDLIDLQGLLRFPSELVIVKISGEKLMAAIEFSVQNYCEVSFDGQFLQMSGLRVVFDMAKPPGKRVVSVKIRNSKSSYNKLYMKKKYNIIITKHMYDNWNEFNTIKEPEVKFLSIPLIDAFKNYIEKVKVINPIPVHEGRITVQNQPALPVGVTSLNAHN